MLVKTMQIAKTKSKCYAKCPECGWTGKPEEVEYGIWIPPGQASLNGYEPEKCDCPDCGESVEIKGE